MSCTPPSPRNWLPSRNGTWITPPSLVSSLAVLDCRTVSSGPPQTGGTRLDVGDALKVGDQVLDEPLPRLEALDEDVGRPELVGAWGASALAEGARRAERRVGRADSPARNDRAALAHARSGVAQDRGPLWDSAHLCSS